MIVFQAQDIHKPTAPLPDSTQWTCEISGLAVQDYRHIAFAISTRVMQTNQQAKTLAEWLGETVHLSPLCQRLMRLKPPHVTLEGWIADIAHLRGATAYPRPPVRDQPGLANEQIGVALCLLHFSADLTRVRMAAQLLSSPNTNVRQLVQLAKMERVERILLHIARCCQRVQPDHFVWNAVVCELRNARPYPAGKLPHWSRFAFHTGMTRDGKPDIHWLQAA